VIHPNCLGLVEFDGRFWSADIRVLSGHRVDGFVGWESDGRPTPKVCDGGKNEMQGPLERVRSEQRSARGASGPTAGSHCTCLPGAPTAGEVGRAKFFRLQWEGVRGFPITGRSGVRYDSCELAVISRVRT
jgi:hypothetical protein